MQYRGVFHAVFKNFIRVVLTVYLINTSINTPVDGCYHCIWLVNIVVLYIFCIHHGICAPLSVFMQYITEYMHRYKSDTDAKPVKFNTLPRHEAMHTTTGFRKKLTHRYAILPGRGLAARARGGEAAGLGAAKPQVLGAAKPRAFPRQEARTTDT